MSDILSAENISMEYNGIPVLSDISFSLPENSSLSIIGPSGCGKSTLLSIAAGLLHPTKGSITLKKDSKHSMVLQDYGLFPWKTTFANLELPLRLQNIPSDTREELTQSMLSELGLNDKGKYFPSQLSGGQRQRVALGRALISKPNIVFLDEPFAALDTITREHLQDFLLTLCDKRKMSFVIVTHNPEEAAYLGRYIMLLRGKPARIIFFMENPGFSRRGMFSDPELRHVLAQLRDSLREDEE